MLKLVAKSVLLAIAGIAVVAPAQARTGKWGAHHPRREEVNDRLQNLDRRIHSERLEGDLSKAQAQTLRKDDRAIRQEERDMAKLGNGHITKTDQRVLNQQENVLSKRIGK